MKHPGIGPAAGWFTASAVALLSPAAAASGWQAGETSLAWSEGSQVIWRFSIDPKHGKPYFHPLSVRGGPTLTAARPADHIWHYGLWFSWKYINGVNYWEEVGEKADEAEARTSWNVTSIETKPDGSATLKLALEYTHPSGRVDLTENRTIRVSAPASDGSYTIDWQAEFTAGPEGAVLDRTPMPHEPNGKVNGGYGGMSLRVAPDPLSVEFVTSAEPVRSFASQRARPAAPVLAANLREGDRDAGAIAIVSDPANSGTDAPWYIVNNPENGMRFLCQAVLAPQPLKLAPGARLKLHYTIAVRREAWTPDALRELTR